MGETVPYSMDPFELNSPEAPPDAPTIPGQNPFASNMSSTTAVSHYNRLDGVKSVLQDMRLKLKVELRQRGENITLQDDIYVSKLDATLAMCESLQALLPWSPDQGTDQ